MRCWQFRIARPGWVAGIIHFCSLRFRPACGSQRSLQFDNRTSAWARARTSRREIAQAGPELSSPADPPIGRYSEEVLSALAGLSPEHRAVVVMRYVLEFTPGEIALALELPRGTVNSRLRRGLDDLKEHLQ